MESLHYSLLFILLCRLYPTWCQECFDSQEKFKAVGKKLTCRKVGIHFQDLCSRSKVRSFCPRTCQECTPSCADTVGTFTRKEKNYNCKKVRKNSIKFCSKAFFQKKCPESCGLCKTQEPTSPPTPSGPGSCEIKANMAFPIGSSDVLRKDR